MHSVIVGDRHVVFDGHSRTLIFSELWNAIVQQGAFFRLLCFTVLMTVLGDVGAVHMIECACVQVNGAIAFDADVFMLMD